AACHYDPFLESADDGRAVRVPDPLGSVGVLDRAEPGEAGPARHHGFKVPAAQWSGSRVRIFGRPGTGALGSALAPSCIAIRQAGIPAHSGWNRSPAFPLLPGYPVPAFRRANS